MVQLQLTQLNFFQTMPIFIISHILYGTKKMFHCYCIRFDVFGLIWWLSTVHNPVNDQHSYWCSAGYFTPQTQIRQLSSPVAMHGKFGLLSPGKKLLRSSPADYVTNSESEFDLWWQYIFVSPWIAIDSSRLTGLQRMRLKGRPDYK